MNLTPIGVIHSPHQQAAGTPVQAALATGVQGTVEVSPRVCGRIARPRRVRAHLAGVLVRPGEACGARGDALLGYDATRVARYPRAVPAESDWAFVLCGCWRSWGSMSSMSMGLDILDGHSVAWTSSRYRPAFDAFEAKRIRLVR